MPVNTNTDVEQVEIVRDGAGDVQRPANTAEQQAIREAIEAGTVNRPGIVGGTITATADGATFADQPVADGFAVAIQNDPSNSGSVQIADDSGTGRHVLKAGATISLAVSNLSVIELIGTGSETVHATVEAP